MTANEQDPDVIKWGLNLLDFDSLFNSSYGCDYNQDDGNTYHGRYTRDYNYITECNSDCNYVENDAMIAHTLQEEFSRLAVGDAAQSSHVEAEHFHLSNVSSDWRAPPSPNYCPVHRDSNEETNDTGHSSSCSSPGERPYDGEDHSYALEFTDESALDGELGKRLDQMVPVPHVLKINGEIPSMDEATSDHQRLLDRLQVYELVERKVQGDGNCQFRSLSDQLYRTPEHHKFVRQQVVNQLKSNPEFYEGYVPMEYGEYLKKMSKSGEWGDHVTLQAAADSYGVKIFLITSFKDTCYMEIIPRVQKSKRVVFLSFWAEVHYNSLYPQGDVVLGGGSLEL
uniref:ubiquitinyl hydrolase 1 n=1 Tax=Opuntia streptacantha TaxID=393608 RepID=A0A7C9D9M6_OPUST